MDFGLKDFTSERSEAKSHISVENWMCLCKWIICYYGLVILLYCDSEFITHRNLIYCFGHGSCGYETGGTRLSRPFTLKPLHGTRKVLNA